MVSKRRLAGAGLAALVACGLAMLSSPAHANNPGLGWFDVPNSGNPALSPGYVCEGSYATTCTPPAAPVLTSPPLYAEQAIVQAIANQSTVKIPGWGSGSPYGGLTWYDRSYTPNPSGQVQLIFTLPSNEYLASCPTAFGGVDGTSFVQVLGLQCNPASNPNTLTAVIQLNPASTSSTAWYQLPSLTIAATSPGLAVLATETANGGTAATFVTNCAHPNPTCSIEATSSGAGSNFGNGLGTILAMSGNELSLATFNASQLICIDLLEDQQPGTRFEQPCGGTIGSNPGAPTNTDGTVAGSVNTPTVNDPACTAGAVEPQCGTGTVYGAMAPSASPDTMVGDTGTIAIGETFMLGPDGIHYAVWQSRSAARAVITLTGSCAGLAGPIENVGSVTASCGLAPFAGETYVGLTSVAFDPTTGIVTNPAGSGPALCPKLDDLPASAGNGGIGGVSGGSQAIWGTNLDTINAIVLPDQSGTKATTTGASFTATGSPTTYYEVCDYASGSQTLGPVSSWHVSVSVDCVPGQYPDCTTLADGGTSPAPPSGQAPDALLTYGFNGIADLFQYTNGNSYAAFLRVVNLMQDYNPVDGSCTATDAAVTSPCEPSGAVVCKIWGDDGANAYVTLWPGAAGAAPVLGETTGTTYDYPIAQLFQQAGVNPSDANPYLLGSLLCFHNANIHLTQWWFEPNGTIINMQ